MNNFFHLFQNNVYGLGWISRQQFEETWAALLGVLSSPLSPEQTSREVYCNRQLHARFLFGRKYREHVMVNDVLE